MFEGLIRDLLYQLLQSRMSIGIFGILIAVLIGAAFSRLIPWWLFFVVLVLLVLGSFLWTFLVRWWAERKDQNLEQGIADQGSRSLGRQKVRDREALKELQTKWKESVDTLKKSRIGRKRQPLYFLPWYVIIGSPACGKSTAIKNSGLHFPMGEPKLAGTGGTRNCDWWFAEEAIILDTAGRYTFHEEHEPDREEWLQFLKLLRKYRPVAPINGLIVAVAADHLMTREPEEVLQEARNIRHKVDQIVRELGIQFPIYLLITKCDLIEGFTDFFGRLPKARLDEMVGWTNPKFEMDDHRKIIGEAVGAIQTRVVEMRTSFLWEEERPKALRKIFLFPEELRAFEKNLEDFSDILFRETQYNESPFLRGIYLTSGIQTGTAISRMLDRLGLKLQATELAESKRSYFLKDLFQLRLSADKNLVASTGRSRGRLQAVHNIALAAVAAVCVAFGVLISNSYIRNRTLLNNLQDAVEAALSAKDLTPSDRIAAQSDYVTYLDKLDALNRSRPFLAGFGLYMGRRAYDPARDLFLTTFAAREYQPSVDAARKVVRQRDLDLGFDGLAALIRNYVLSKELNGTMREPTGSNESLVEFWSRGEPVTPEELGDFDHAYFTFLRWRPADQARADETGDLDLIRTSLPEMFTVENVSRWANRHCPTFRATEIPVPATVAGGAEVTGAFTPDCWRQRVLPLIGVVDLVAEDVDAQLVPQFQRSYVTRYLESWRAFLLGARIAPDGAIGLGVLLGEQTPYLAMVDATAAGVQIESPEIDLPAWTKTVARVSGERAEYLAQLQSAGRQTSAAERDTALAFEGAREVFTRRPASAFNDASGADNQAADPFGKALTWVEKTTDVGAATNASDHEVRERVAALLDAPIYDAWGTYLLAAGKEIDRQWRFKVVNAIANAKSAADAEAVYSESGGDLWKFFEQYLAPFVEGQPSFSPKIRYKKSVPIRDLGGFMGAVQKWNRSRKDASGQPRRYTLQFDARPTDNPPGDLEATRTVLSIECGEGEPWTLEHRQFRQAKSLAWTPEKCQRVELQVWVGSAHRAGDERPLAPLSFSGPTALADFLRSASHSGNEYSWRLSEGFTAIFVISGIDSSLLSGAGDGGGIGVRPPSSVLR